ncbi:MAG: 30S ribosomal protein S12 methylthiotransferase RimO [Pseudomonadota bacterium]
MADSRRVGFVSLGCPKALVDSEHIVTGLTRSGYEVVEEDTAADVVVINTCGFIDHAKAESYEAIERALDEAGEVVVTGCLGADAAALKQRYPQLKFVSGPAEVQPVMDAVATYVPPGDARATALPGEARTRLTPAHYAYLKISEGCNHTCSFCIIPQMRGKLRSRLIGDVLREAEALVADGAQELLVIAQDLSAYGVDLRYAEDRFHDAQLVTNLHTLCEQLGAIAPWVRLHYVYPYPSVDRLIPLMAEGKLLPYLDIPLQHAAPDVLKAMRRPAAAEKTLERIKHWRQICPEIAIRSTFIVGFPGETEAHVGQLLDFLEEAELDRVGCFTYSAVEGAQANLIADHVDENDKLDRQEMVYETQAQISRQRLNRHVGQTLRVLVDEVVEQQGDTWLVGRSQFDAPEIDGLVHARTGGQPTRPGDFAWVKITDHDDHDLTGTVVGSAIQLKDA